MSHRDDCPSRWDAEREGERAFEYGRCRYANPYDDPFHRGQGCPEAERSWDDGYRRAERREEERCEEEAAARRSAARRSAARRAEAEAEEAYYLEQQYEAEQFQEPPEQVAPMREIHAAGPMVDWLQRCARCGEVLSDYRNSMIPDGDPPPSGWAVGAHVEIEGVNPKQSWVTDDAPTCEELPTDSIEEHGLS